MAMPHHIRVVKNLSSSDWMDRISDATPSRIGFCVLDE